MKVKHDKGQKEKNTASFPVRDFLPYFILLCFSKRKGGEGELSPCFRYCSLFGFLLFFSFFFNWQYRIWYRIRKDQKDKQ